MLPSGITNIFSNDERERFTSIQENVSEDEVIDEISRECCNGDREKGKVAYQEAIKVLREKTVRQRQHQEGEGFLDNIFDNLKGRGRGLF
jgi:hypothetical protein